MVLGHVVEVGLGALEQALAGEPPRRDGDPGLPEVVGGLVARLRVEEGRQPLDLVLVQQPQVQHEGEGPDAENHQQGDPAEPRPRHQHDRERQEDHDEHGAQVGLEVDQPRRDGRQGHGKEDLPESRVRPLVAPDRRQRDDQRDLHDLGGLDLQDPHRDPALRPGARVPHRREDQEQEPDPGCVDQRRQASELAVVEEQRDHEDDHRQGEERELALQVEVGVVAEGELARPRGGEDGDAPQPRQRHRRREQRQVEVPQWVLRREPAGQDVVAADALDPSEVRLLARHG